MKSFKFFLLLAVFALFFVACGGGGGGDDDNIISPDDSSGEVFTSCDDDSLSIEVWQQNCGITSQKQNGQTIDDCFPDCLTPDASQVKSGEMPEEEIKLEELLTDPAYEGSEGVLREGEN